jgi:hypothetical protein
VWAVALGVVLAALGLQVQYADSTGRCIQDSQDLLALCQGPLVTPATLLAGCVLVAIGLWLILARANGGDPAR